MSDSYEAMIRDADFPSMTVRFCVLPGAAAIAGGIYRIERIRTATDDDVARYSGFPEPKCYHCGKSDQDD